VTVAEIEAASLHAAVYCGTVSHESVDAYSPGGPPFDDVAFNQLGASRMVDDVTAI
jgi:hypothetical protein